MYIFNAISLLGGLAMFLYGMRLMGDSLKVGASGTLKKAMERVTNNPIKAFLMGVCITAVIQSSTATIVITSGLVAAGIITLDNSLGIIIGANVGTTVTGQIIRLLDIDAESGSVLQFFQPSTLAPLALIIGIILVMFCKFRQSDVIGNIAVGFGILFSGLLNMTGSVSDLTAAGGPLENLFSGLGNSPVLSYLSGAGTAFILQSSSATIGILQAFSVTGDLVFKSVFLMIVGIYLGDCLTTGIVCSIGAKPDARRVGVVNILFNLSETLLVLIVVNLLHGFGLIDRIWNMVMTSGTIANTNTVFNLACSVLLLPLVKVYGRLSRVIIKDEKKDNGKYSDILNGLNPVFFDTPAIAFSSCYEAIKTMFNIAYNNILSAISLLENYNPKVYNSIEENEEIIDSLTDKLSDYLCQLSGIALNENQILILDEYNKIVSCYERIGDHGVNIASAAKIINENSFALSHQGKKELYVIRDLLIEILDNAQRSFEKKDITSAKSIEPLKEVMDDLINAVHDNYLTRLREHEANVTTGMYFLKILTNTERICDICSDVGVTTIARLNPELQSRAHSYISTLHSEKDEDFMEKYEASHSRYFALLD